MIHLLFLWVDVLRILFSLLSLGRCLVIIVPLTEKIILLNGMHFCVVSLYLLLCLWGIGRCMCSVGIGYVKCVWKPEVTIRCLHKLSSTLVFETGFLIVSLAGQ